MKCATTIPIAIVGATGYAGEELCRLLSFHPFVEIVAVFSRQHVGQRVGTVIPSLEGYPISNLLFLPADAQTISKMDISAVFLSLPHGVATQYAELLLDSGKIIIDLSSDFRIKNPKTYLQYYGVEHPCPHLLSSAIYSLPEFVRDQIPSSSLIASPGCYATSIELPLMPLLQSKLIQPFGIVSNSLSGISGAGRNIIREYLFSECDNSIRAYSVPKHRHLAEIEEQFLHIANQEVKMLFIPHLVPINRGIHTTTIVKMVPSISFLDMVNFLKNRYDSEKFIRLKEEPPEIKNVIGTNFCDITLIEDKYTQQVVILSVIDNLIKGAGGQAIQSFNIKMGFPESTALLP